jgi:hypothetical protein
MVPNATRRRYEGGPGIDAYDYKDAPCLPHLCLQITRTTSDSTTARYEMMASTVTEESDVLYNHYSQVCHKSCNSFLSVIMQRY